MAKLALIGQFICIVFKHHWQIEFKSPVPLLVNSPANSLANQWMKPDVCEKEQCHFFFFLLPGLPEVVAQPRFLIIFKIQEKELVFSQLAIRPLIRIIDY